MPQLPILLLLEFQSTHPQGVRLIYLGWPTKKVVEFQSTHPQGVRPRQMENFSDSLFGFNPRTRRGCDDIPVINASSLCVSIHAPAGGATGPVWGCGSQISCFNPRTRRGCDPIYDADDVDELEFQSTHPQGVRPGIFCS